MSSIDLAILGMVIEKSQSAYDIQKDVEYHNFSRWTKISIPSIYRRVIKLNELGYLKSDTQKGSRFADKIVYSITDEGKIYFKELMHSHVSKQIPLLFDFNVAITNLNKLSKKESKELIIILKKNINDSLVNIESYASEYKDIPSVGRTIFKQQRKLYNSLLEWLEEFENEYNKRK